MIGIVIAAFGLSMIGLIIWNLEKQYIEEIEELNEYIAELEITNNYFVQVLREVKDDIKVKKTNKEARERIECLFSEE